MTVCLSTESGKHLLYEFRDIQIEEDEYGNRIVDKYLKCARCSYQAKKDELIILDQKTISSGE